MANITQLIKNIRSAVFGKDVRESIAAAIEQTYEDASEKGNANMEVTQARGTFDTLKKRLDNSDSVKADKTALQSETTSRQSADSNLQTQINSLANGSPLVASSVSEMTDTTRVYVNATDGHWYYYNGSAWTDGGVYQATEIANGIVSPLKTNFMDKVNVIPDDGWKSDYILNFNTGVETSFNGGCYSETYIEIPENETKIFCMSKSRLLYGMHIYFYSNNKTFISSLPAYAITQNQLAIPADSKFFRVGYETSTNKPDTIIIFKSIFDIGINIYEEGYLKEGYNGLDGKNILYNKKRLNILPFAFKNNNYSYSGNKIHYNYTIQAETSQDFNGFSVNFDIKENDKIKLKVSNENNININQFLCFNSIENNFQLDGQSRNGTANVANGEAEFTITSSMIPNIKNNCVYFTFLSPGNNTENDINCSFDIEIEINDDYYYFADLIKNFEKETPRTYKAMFLGDSITQLSGNRGWWTYFNEILNVTQYVNVAVWGATLKDKENTNYDGNPLTEVSENNVLGNQVQKIINNQATYITPDLILIAIGINDGINTTLETAYSQYYDTNGDKVSLSNVDRKTSAGAFRYVNEKLHELYPDAMIAWCTPIQAANAIRDVKEIIKYGDNLKLLCSINSNYCIDTEKCGINSINEIANHNGQDLQDGLHPNANGAKKMGTFNACEFKKFLDRINKYQQ